jgi:hypothetical protein
MVNSPYGDHPFDQIYGLLSARSLEMIDGLKRTDGIPARAAELLREFLGGRLLEAVVSALEKTARLSPASRTLDGSLDSLRLTDSLPLVDSLVAPMRSIEIPDEVCSNLQEPGI